MSCYLCSNETLSIVADVVSTNFDIEVEEAFNELLTYNLENLKARYNDEDWGQETSHYIKQEYSKAQEIQSIRNYLYQTDDYVTNDKIEWLQLYSSANYPLVERSTEKIYWDYANKQYDNN